MWTAVTGTPGWQERSTLGQVHSATRKRRPGLAVRGQASQILTATPSSLDSSAATSLAPLVRLALALGTHATPPISIRAQYGDRALLAMFPATALLRFGEPASALARLCETLSKMTLSCCCDTVGPNHSPTRPKYHSIRHPSKPMPTRRTACYRASHTATSYRREYSPSSIRHHAAVPSGQASSNKAESAGLISVSVNNTSSPAACAAEQNVKTGFLDNVGSITSAASILISSQ